MSINRRFWFGWAGVMTVLGTLALWLDPVPGTLLTVPVWVLLMWLLPWVGLRAAARGATGERVRGIGLAFALVGGGVALHIGGLLLFQPMRSQPPGLGYGFFLLASIWLLAFVVGFNSDDERLRAFGRKVAASRFSGLLVLTIFGVLLVTAAEYALRFVVIQSFGATPSIVMSNYLTLTWGETNSLDIRDNREPIPPADPDTRTLIVVGDSVAAGFGIDNRENRLSNILDERLGDKYAVYLLARPGWETQTQFENLRAYPVPPDVVVISYFTNDVLEAYDDLYGIPEPVDETENVLIQNLFIPSLVYWNYWYPRQQRQRPDQVDLTDPVVLAAHADEIREVVGWVRGQGADVLYVVWPHPVVMEGQAPLLNTVRGTLDELDVPYVDMEEAMRPYPVRERVATAYDPHPSAEMHRIAAAEVWNLMVDTGLVTGP